VTNERLPACHERVLPKNVRVSGGDNGIAPEQQDALVCANFSKCREMRLLRRFPTDEGTRDWRFLPSELSVTSYGSDFSTKKIYGETNPRYEEYLFSLA